MTGLEGAGVLVGKQLIDSLKDNPELARGVWDKILRYSIGLPYPIAITGHRGVGKTVLLSALGGTLNPDPPQSTKAEREVVTERGKVTQGATRLVFTTIPGDDSTVKRQAQARTLAGRGGAKGIIHLFANGRVTLRDYERIEAGTADEHIETFQREELLELDRLCRDIERVIGEEGRPSWLLLAHAKADLYADAVDGLVQRTRAGDDAVSAVLERLRERVGSNNFNWGVAPLSLTAKPLKVGGEAIRPQIDPAEGFAHLTEFAAALKGLAHGR